MDCFKYYTTEELNYFFSSLKLTHDVFIFSNLFKYKVRHKYFHTMYLKTLFKYRYFQSLKGTKFRALGTSKPRKKAINL